MSGKLIVISGPSGVGKSTVLKRVMEQTPNLHFSVSATTRPMRPGEVDGLNYFFVSREAFQQMISDGALLEYAEYVGNYYGTPEQPVNDQLAAGYDVVLEIEVQGGKQIKTVAPDCISIFLVPPSLEVLEKRLRGRGTETEAVIQERLAAAREEIPHVLDYDYTVVNDTVEQAVIDIQAILEAEKLRVSRDQDIVERILNHA